MALKIKAGAINAIKAKMNIQVAEGTNPHPWIDPVRALFGSEEKFPDILDFFKAISQEKKSLHQKPITLEELLQLCIQSYDENSGKVDPSKWSKMLGAKYPVEGAAYTTLELNEVARATKEHYALVCVPSGFDWAARGINMKGLLVDLGWWENIPSYLQEVWDIAVLISIWCVYEGLGLGGLNKLALSFHQLMRQYAKKGSLASDTIPDHLYEMWVDFDKEPYEFLENIWFQLLAGEGILDKWASNPAIFELVLFLAQGRELVWAMNNGLIYKEKGSYLRSVSLNGLEPEQTRALAAACQLLRDGAKGRLNLQEIQEKSGEVKGALHYLGEKDDANILMTINDLPGEEMGVTSISLIEVYQLMLEWTLGRQQAKERKYNSQH